MDEEHKAPWQCTYAKEDRSKCKAGDIPKSDQEYFEILCLCILQAGLSWRMVRKNWQKYRKGFYNFNINQLVEIQPDDLMKNPNVIRNAKKVKAIIYDAKEFQKIKKEYGSFSNFLESLKQIKDQEVFKLLTKKFEHLGSYTAEYYLHCVGYWE